MIPRERATVSLPHPSPLPQCIFNCFQNGGLRRRFSTSVRNKTPALQASESIACEQALGLGVWVFVGGRGWGEGKERELAAMSHEFECRP